MKKNVRFLEEKKKLLLVIFFLFLSSFLLAQQKIIVTGTVVDSLDAGPLPGVSVLAKGTKKGVVTDMTGKYAIEVTPNSSLIFKYLGYQERTFLVGDKTVINVKLSSVAKGLDEVVVVGYGTQNARDVSSSISTIKAEDINKVNTPTLEGALQGRAAGLQISSPSGEPGGVARIRIRGNNSISGDNSPLIVLDGYPLISEAAPNGGLGAASSSALSFINMDDVESIQVLKDASATAIYGSRGANGVLLITTKKGNAGSTVINFSAESFMIEPIKFPEMMNGPQYAEFGNSFNRNGTGLPGNTDTITTRWIDQIIQPAWGQNYNMSLSGGNPQNRYFVSGSYSDYKGVIIGSGFDRATLRANLINKLSDKLSVTTSFNYSVTGNNFSAGSNGTSLGGVVFNALISSPLVPADKFDELFTDDAQLTQPTNPILQLTDSRDKSGIQNLLANITLNYQVFKDLKFTAQGGTNMSLNNREMYWGKKTGLGYLRNSQGMLIDNFSTNYLTEFYANYTKSINKHNINAVIGYSAQKNINKTNMNVGTGFLSDGMGIYGLQFASSLDVYNYNRVDRALESYYFRANYNFTSKYLLSFSGRMDGSSVFADNNKYSFFPAVSLAWRVNEEEFMKNLPFISELKLRGGYGLTGSQAIQPYQSIPQYQKAYYVLNNAEVPGVRPIVMGNPDLKWETTGQLNAGLDLKILKGKFGLTFDYYDKTTRDLLLPFQVPGSAGYPSIILNKGSIGNKGFEIMLSGSPVKTKKFSWETNVNYSRNRSKVLDLGGLSYISGPKLDNNFVNENITGQFVGQPFSMFYGYELNGLIQPEDFDANGKPLFPMLANIKKVGFQKFKDQNGDGKITAADRVFLGDPNPKFHFGFNNDFSYKNFSLNIFIQGSYGNKVFNASKIYVGSGFGYFNQTEDWYVNRWTPDNPHNKEQYPSGSDYLYFKPTSATVEDGSYARLKNVSLRYNVPLKKNIRLLQLYVTGTNLLTLTRYSGSDPEANLFGNRNDAIGVDFFSYPQSTTFTLGFKLGL